MINPNTAEGRALVKYLNQRLEENQAVLDRSDDPHVLFRKQGARTELKSLLAKINPPAPSKPLEFEPSIYS